MRFMADENVGGETVEALRSAGHDVTWVREDSPGITDDEVLSRAFAQDRVLITADKDFGELAFRAASMARGIILVRARGSLEMRTAALLAAIRSRSDWSALFAVVENDRVRITQLPGSD